jgi:hypothetical protein
MPIRVPALTGLRFVAAMMVLIGHGWSVLHFTGDTITGALLNPLPSMGMTLFFVLSGFVMWVNYAQPLRERFWPALWRFGVARFARLYPLYAAVLAFALLTTNWTTLPTAMPDALLFIPLLQAWVPGTIGPSAVFAIPNLSHAWSISVEMFLYLCFPGVALALAGRGRFRLWLLLSLNLAFYAAGYYFYLMHMAAVTTLIAPGLIIQVANMWVGYLSPITRVSEFLSGCLVGAIIMRSPRGPATGLQIFAPLGIGGLLILAGALFATPLGLPGVWPPVAIHAACLSAFTWLVWRLARFEGALTLALSSRTMLAGGEISYSLYLLHPFILPAFAKPEMKFTGLHFALWLALLAMAGVCTVAMSYGTWSLIEVPARRWLRRALAPAQAGSPLRAQAAE